MIKKVKERFAGIPGMQFPSGIEKIIIFWN